MYKLRRASGGRLGLGTAPGASDAEIGRRAAGGGVRVVRLHLARRLDRIQLDRRPADTGPGLGRTPTLAGEASR